MNDNFENHGFQTPEEGRKPLEQQAMPGQASTNGETQSWQQAQQIRPIWQRSMAADIRITVRRARVGQHMAKRKTAKQAL